MTHISAEAQAFDQAKAESLSEVLRVQERALDEMLRAEQERDHAADRAGFAELGCDLCQLYLLAQVTA